MSRGRTCPGLPILPDVEVSAIVGVPSSAEERPSSTATTKRPASVAHYFPVDVGVYLAPSEQLSVDCCGWNVSARVGQPPAAFRGHPKHSGRARITAGKWKDGG